mmetsp:Transcript_22670/g.70398  ORF Transcript_22670/g.70398 Transcript_22670/m.70398 type:complete len:290 (-) Transcript_22670:237-1106(-)
MAAVTCPLWVPSCSTLHAACTTSACFTTSSHPFCVARLYRQPRAASWGYSREPPRSTMSGGMAPAPMTTFLLVALPADKFCSAYAATLGSSSPKSPPLRRRPTSGTMTPAWAKLPARPGCEARYHRVRAILRGWAPPASLPPAPARFSGGSEGRGWSCGSACSRCFTGTATRARPWPGPGVGPGRSISSAGIWMHPSPAISSSIILTPGGKTMRSMSAPPAADAPCAARAACWACAACTPTMDAAWRAAEISSARSRSGTTAVESSGALEPPGSTAPCASNHWASDARS